VSYKGKRIPFYEGILPRRPRQQTIKYDVEEVCETSIEEHEREESLILEFRKCIFISFVFVFVICENQITNFYPINSGIAGTDPEPCIGRCGSCSGKYRKMDGSTFRRDLLPTPASL